MVGPMCFEPKPLRRLDIARPEMEFSDHGSRRLGQRHYALQEREPANAQSDPNRAVHY
jgi:hypothetical protein